MKKGPPFFMIILAGIVIHKISQYANRLDRDTSVIVARVKYYSLNVYNRKKYAAKKNASKRCGAGAAIADEAAARGW
jgi:hypothetical protein